MARERDRLSYGLQDHAVSLVRFSPIHRISKFLYYLFASLNFNGKKIFTLCDDGGENLSLVT